MFFPLSSDGIPDKHLYVLGKYLHFFQRTKQIKTAPNEESFLNKIY